MSAADESDIAQARVFLALLNSEIDELSERIESTLRLVRVLVRAHLGWRRRRAPMRRLCVRTFIRCMLWSSN